MGQPWAATLLADSARQLAENKSGALRKGTNGTMAAFRFPLRISFQWPVSRFSFQKINIIIPPR
jgi:hypothetical protein